MTLSTETRDKTLALLRSALSIIERWIEEDEPAAAISRHGSLASRDLIKADLLLQRAGESNEYGHPRYNMHEAVVQLYQAEEGQLNHLEARLMTKTKVSEIWSNWCVSEACRHIRTAILLIEGKE